MYVNYTQQEYSEQVHDEQTKDQLAKKWKEKKITELFISEYLEKTKKLKKTQAKICEFAAPVGSYLDKNAILVFNEAARAYIDLEIKSIMAENEAGASCKIKLLKQSLQKVEEEKHMLELCVAKGKPVEDTFTLSDVATFLRVIGYSKNNYLKCISMDPATIGNYMKKGYSVKPRKATRNFAEQSDFIKHILE
uniref:Uncharacterized protein n=1 Tax=Ditylenchus dipsaci TaxID=166011 RepID=A0A915E4A9_9BILA